MFKQGVSKPESENTPYKRDENSLFNKFCICCLINQRIPRIKGTKDVNIKVLKTR